MDIKKPSEEYVTYARIAAFGLWALVFLIIGFVLGILVTVALVDSVRPY